jgi:hypothetical protein
MQTQTYRMRSTPRPIPTNSASCASGNPNKVYSRRCRDCGKEGDSGRSPTLGPCVQENAAQEDREDELRDHR